MANGQRMKKESAPASNTSGDLTKLPHSESMPPGASANSSKTTTATMPKGTQKTLTNAKLRELRSKAGIVAGALADFQTAGGIVAVKRERYSLADGMEFYAMKIGLIVIGANVVAVQTDDGLELDVVAE
jgi:hypothetical protein